MKRCLIMKVRISDISQFLLAHAASSVFCLHGASGQLLEQEQVPADKRQDYFTLPLLAEAQTIAICWDYIEEIDDDEIRHELQSILKRHDEDHEFPEFTEALCYHGLEEEWETYKEECLQHILADWCEHKGVAYSD